NYLLPQKVAVEATPGNLKQLEARRHNIEKREASRIDTAEKAMAALDGKSVTVAMRVGEEGQLFGSVTPQRIAEAANDQLNIELDRKRIDLTAPIKTVGAHTATVAIYRDIKAVLTVVVVDENAAADADAAADDAAPEAPQAEAAADDSAAVVPAEGDGAEAVATDDAATAEADAAGESAPAEPASEEATAN
ncbi:MAG: 50S ribosomal protein L9, partial [Coriobacteriales bacterium]|nr:50S ribosomal protein L9 [Coriobacteriales bacterium]